MRAGPGTTHRRQGRPRGPVSRGLVPSRSRASICECTSGPGTSRSSALPRYDLKSKLSSSPVSDCRPSWGRGQPRQAPYPAVRRRHALKSESIPGTSRSQSCALANWQLQPGCSSRQASLCSGTWTLPCIQAVVSRWHNSASSLIRCRTPFLQYPIMKVLVNEL